MENENENDNVKKEAKRNIEVVKGDGNLAISPVYRHLEVEKPKPKPKKSAKIFVPEVKKDKK